MHERHRLLQSYGWAVPAVLTVPTGDPAAETADEKKTPR